MKYCGDNKVVNINDSSEILKLCHRNQFHIFDEYFVNTNFNHKLNVFSCAQIFVNYFCSENSYSDLDKSLINISNSLMVSKSNIIYLNIILSKKFHSAFQINIMTLSVLYSSEIHHVYFLCPIRGLIHQLVESQGVTSVQVSISPILMVPSRHLTYHVESRNNNYLFKTRLLVQFPKHVPLQERTGFTCFCILFRKLN